MEKDAMKLAVVILGIFGAGYYLGRYSLRKEQRGA